MSIVTVANLFAAFDSDRIKQFASDYTSGTGQPTYLETTVTSVLTNAEGLILLALSKQYTQSELEADAGIKRITLDIAMYLLESRKGNPSQIITDAYIRSQKILSDLQDGTSKLADVAQLLPTISVNNSSDALEITSQGYFDGVHDSEYYD